MSKKKKARKVDAIVAAVDAEQVVDVSSDVKDVTISTSDAGVLTPNYLRSFMASYLTTGTGPIFATAHPKPRNLRDAVSEQVRDLTAGFDGVGGEELPEPPRDLTAYRDAHASAMANCQHEDAVELLYGRQWVCDDCSRILNRDDMRKAHGRRPWWLG